MKPFTDPARDRARPRGILLCLGPEQSVALTLHAAHARAAYNHALTSLSEMVRTGTEPEGRDALTLALIRDLDQARASQDGPRLAGGFRPVQAAALTELAHLFTRTGHVPGLRTAGRGENVLVPDVTLQALGRGKWVTGAVPGVGRVPFRWADKSFPSHGLGCALRFARFGAGGGRWYVYVMKDPVVPVLVRGPIREPLTAAWSSRPWRARVPAGTQVQR